MSLKHGCRSVLLIKNQILLLQKLATSTTTSTLFDTSKRNTTIDSSHKPLHKTTENTTNQRFRELQLHFKKLK